ncbi:MAG: leucyl aminopeptidase family protein [Actinomycetales bacterium]|nr:leucyl aminopeptidase family protein [Actinomycetales bacterium]
MLTFKRGDQLSKKANQILLPVIEGKVSAPEIAKLFDLNLEDELAFFLSADKPLKAGEIFEIPVSAQGYKCERLSFVSIGKLTNSDLRQAGASVGRRLRGKGDLVFFKSNLKPAQLKSFLVSANLGNFTWNLKTGAKTFTSVLEVSNCEDEVLTKAQIVSDAVNRARQLIHTPSNIKNPEWIAKQAKKYANGTKVEVKSGVQLNEFGGLKAVGGSSPKPGPRFIKMSYAPRKSGAKHIVLVGKGITYDTGGISLKRPYDIMIPMKSDMAGAAACLAVMSALKDLKVNVKVTALLMCAENAISGTAQRPGDVITHYGGKTVEILNTDAEGRLVLADGLAYAVKNLKPDYLIDIATLTGSATLGLGKQYAALYSRNQKWIKELREAGESSGDRVWHMPLIDDYEIALESDIADINHTADKGDFNAGSVTAALFLEQFVDGANWAHLDIAGVGRAESDAGENPKGGTGWGVRLLLEWIGSFK